MSGITLSAELELARLRIQVNRDFEERPELQDNIPGNWGTIILCINARYHFTNSFSTEQRHGKVL
jgi:hypothetical protein